MLVVGCHSHPTDVRQENQLPAIWPDYTGVTIPVGIAPLNFAMADDAFETVDVTVMGSEAGSLHANGSYADFDVDDWHHLLESNRGGHLTFTVCAEKDDEWTQYHDFQVFVSREEMDAWGSEERISMDSRILCVRLSAAPWLLKFSNFSRYFSGLVFTSRAIKSGSSSLSHKISCNFCGKVPFVSSFVL